MSSRSTPHPSEEIMCPACGGAHDPAVTLCYGEEAARLGRDTPVAADLRRGAGDMPEAGRQRRDTNPVAVDASAAQSLLPGTTVGEFVVENVIGAGGMGVVYRATHPLIGKKAVIKVIKASLGLGSEHVERFIREARAVNQIGHPNIVDVFSFGTLPDKRPYLVMEWLQGESLGTRLDRGRLPMREGIEILLQICSALDAAHTYGVIHRDLKPDNVYLVALPNDDRPLVKILDFGLAKIIEPKNDLFLGGSNEGVILGTPTYLSPEQARGQSGDHRVDTYTLGVMAFEMFTGHRPFVGASAIDTILLHVSKPAPRARTLAPELPAAIDEIVLQLMAKDPAQRPSLSRVRSALTAELIALDEARAREPVEDMTGVGTADFKPALRQLAAPEAAWTGNSSGSPLSDLEERKPEPIRDEKTRMDTNPIAMREQQAANATPTPVSTRLPTPTQPESLSGKTTPFKRVSAQDLQLDALPSPSRVESQSSRLSAVGIPIPPQAKRVVFGSAAATPRGAPPPNPVPRRVTLSGPDLLASLPSIDDEPTRLPIAPRQRRTIEPRPLPLPAVSAPIASPPPPPVAPLSERGTMPLVPQQRQPRLGEVILATLRRHAVIIGAGTLVLLLGWLGLTMVRWSDDPTAAGDRVRILLHGLPKGSTVTWDKRVLTSNPAWVERGTTPRQLEIASPGYDTVRINTVPKSNLEFTVELGTRKTP